MLEKFSVADNANIKGRLHFRANVLGKRQAGFTLLELLIVVAILAAVAGTTALVLTNVDTDTHAKMARVEIQAVAKAIRQFKADTGYYPKKGQFAHKDDGGKVGTAGDLVEKNRLYNPANFDQLFNKPADNIGNAIMVWNVDTGRGWRGPYLDRSGEGLVDIGDNIKIGGTGEPTDVDTNPFDNVPGIADAFSYSDPVYKNTNYNDCTEGEQDTEDCLLEWRSFNDDYDTYKTKIHYIGAHGRPYLLFFDPSNSPRIVSMGLDGKYGGCDDNANDTVNPDVPDGVCDDKDTDLCSPRGDDLVICIN